MAASRRLYLSYHSSLDWLFVDRVACHLGCPTVAILYVVSELLTEDDRIQQILNVLPSQITDIHKQITLLICEVFACSYLLLALLKTVAVVDFVGNHEHGDVQVLHLLQPEGQLGERLEVHHRVQHQSYIQIVQVHSNGVGRTVATGCLTADLRVSQMCRNEGPYFRV